MTGCGRVVINFFLACLLFIFFQTLGWVNINETKTVWEAVFWSGVILTAWSGIIFLIMVTSVYLLNLVGDLGKVIILVLVSFAIIFLPMLVYWGLNTAGGMAGLFTMTSTWWQTYLIGLAFMVFQVPVSTKSNSSDTEYVCPSYSPGPTVEPVFERVVPKEEPKTEASRRWSGDMVVKPAPVKNPNLCDHCGQGVSKKEKKCSGCSAPNSNYNPD